MRPSADQLPEWVEDFHGEGWAAVPSPDSERSKAQRRARLWLGLVLVSLPVSLISCVSSCVALVSGGSAGESPAPPQPPPQAQAQAQAQLAAEKWLVDGGVTPASLAWQGFETSRLPCGPSEEAAYCESHDFSVLLSGDMRVRLTVTVDPATGATAGVYMSDEPLDQWGRAGSRPVWVTANPAVRGDLPPGHEEELSQWAAAWTANDQSALRYLAGQDPSRDSEHSTLGQDGWTTQGGVEVLSVLEAPAPRADDTVNDYYLATVSFPVARACTVPIPGDQNAGPAILNCAECTTTAAEAGAEAGDIRTCDEALMVTADLRIKESDNRTIVLGSSRVGETGPEDPIPETGEQPQQTAAGQDGRS